MYRRRLKGYAAIGYKIRANEIFFNAPQPTINIIYDGSNFLKPFLTDVAKAKESVIISSPKVRLIRRNTQILDLLQDLSLRGVRVIVVTRESNDDVERIKQRGIDIALKPNLTLCCSIIDKKHIWYGSINVLGYHATDDNAMRFCDNGIADSLLGIFYG